MLNKVQLIGRLGADPELRHTPSGSAVATFNLATNERFKDSNGESQETTEWHRIVVWGKLAEICAQYLAKGKLIYVEGSIKTREYEHKDGNNRRVTEIVARTMQMLDRAGNGSKSKDVPPPTDGDIPF